MNYFPQYDSNVYMIVSCGFRDPLLSVVHIWSTLWPRKHPLILMFFVLHPLLCPSVKSGQWLQWFEGSVHKCHCGCWSSSLMRGRLSFQTDSLYFGTLRCFAVEMVWFLWYSVHHPEISAVVWFFDCPSLTVTDLLCTPVPMATVVWRRTLDDVSVW